MKRPIMIIAALALGLSGLARAQEEANEGQGPSGDRPRPDRGPRVERRAAEVEDQDRERGPGRPRGERPPGLQREDRGGPGRRDLRPRQRELRSDSRPSGRPERPGLREDRPSRETVRDRRHAEFSGPPRPAPDRFESRREGPPRGERRSVEPQGRGPRRNIAPMNRGQGPERGPQVHRHGPAPERGMRFERSERMWRGEFRPSFERHGPRHEMVPPHPVRRSFDGPAPRDDRRGRQLVRRGPHHR